ncbi:MAG: SH3 domain-containing protein [Pseudomonadota bacterium]
MNRFALILALLLAMPALAAVEPSILNPSGLPVPRYVSLKSDDVNVRVGPGKRYPIRWVYKRAHLPVEIVEEFAHWRKIRDYQGTTGWVHKGMVDGKRSIMVMDKPQNLYADPEATANPIMRAAPLVIGDLKKCEPDWCQVEIQNRKAWIRKADIWGVSREEVFGD